MILKTYRFFVRVFVPGAYDETTHLEIRRGYYSTERLADWPNRPKPQGVWEVVRGWFV